MPHRRSRVWYHVCLPWYECPETQGPLLTHYYYISSFILQQTSVKHPAFAWDGIHANMLSQALFIHRKLSLTCGSIARKESAEAPHCIGWMGCQLNKTLMFHLISAKVTASFWVETPNRAEGLQVGSRAESKCLCSHELQVKWTTDRLLVQEPSCVTKKYAGRRTNPKMAS